jgi:uncharacterized repeat protein (TIGR01451 family)
VITRLVQGKRPRRTVPTVVAAGVIIAATLLATGALAALVTDSGTVNIIVPDETQSADFTFASGANVAYIGDASSKQSSGTGLFDPFVRIQGSGKTAPTEKGYNTCSQSSCGGDVSQFDTKTGSWTKAIKASAIPIVDCDGNPNTVGNCWELFNDINEGNSAKYISLTKVEVWFTTSATLTGYPFPVPGTTNNSLEYQFTGEIKMQDVNSGSGRGDLRYLIPIAGHPFNSSTYFVLYSEWGSLDTAPDSKNFATEGGFEEWKVRKAPSLQITKTADAASVSAGSPIGFVVTITNNGPADATGVTISDTLPGGAGIDWSENSASCSISGSPGVPPEVLSCGPVTLAANGGSLSVHLTSPTTAASCGTYDNRATFTSTNAGSGFADASTVVQCGALVIHKNSTKSGTPAVANAGAEFCYSTTTGCTTTNVTDTVDGTLGDKDAAVGSVCVDGLAPGAYKINETKAPPGYGLSANGEQTVTVLNGTNCTSPLPGAGATATFTNPPLADIVVRVDGQSSGEINSSISCVDSSNNSIGSVGDPTPLDPAVLDVNDLPPDTYTCTLVIDP